MIVGLELSNINNTLSILEENIKEFSEELEKTQFEAKDEKVFVSIQGRCIDKLGRTHCFILSYKFTVILDLLVVQEALVKDVLRCDYIKVKVFN